MKRYIVIVWILSSAALHAQPVQLNGYLKFFAHPNLNDPYLLDRYGTRLQLALSHSTGERADLYCAFDFNLEENNSTGLADEPRSAITEIYPVEAYLDLHWTQLDIRVGKQFILWGKTDWINPTDNITPWDYQNITAEIEDYRLAVTALKVNWYPGLWTIEAVLLPVFKPNRIPLDFPSKIGPHEVIVEPPNLPDSRPRHWQTGLRISSYLWGFDYSCSFWQGFDLYPTVVQKTIPNPAGGLPLFQFETHYLLQRVWGLDFVRSIGRWNIKGEGAYFRTSDPAGTNVFIKNPFFKYVLGCDFSPFDELTLTLQFVQEVLLKYDREREYRVHQAMGNPTPRVSDRITNSVSSRIQYQLTDYWNIQTIGVLNLKDKDFFLLPILKYSFADGVNIYAGATVFHGPTTSPFGQNKKYSRAFLEVKYNF